MTEKPIERDPVDWEHYQLWGRVREALYATPDQFTTPTTSRACWLQTFSH